MTEAVDTLRAIAGREGFLATGDPALREDADRGQVSLLGYGELYELWERQQWATQEIDFSRDRADWQGSPMRSGSRGCSGCRRSSSASSG